ncbi:MAG: ribonuclease Z [Catalinimonas sp.]
MVFEIKILGSNSASFAFGRHHTAQIINHNHQHYLVDCGEGTQIQMARYRVRLNKIDHVFISHLHGDHYLGLMGLVSTMHLQGRKQDLHLFGPPGLADIIIPQLRVSDTRLNYKIHFQELRTDQSEQILENGHLTVTTLPLDHRIACCGFLFREKPKRRRLIKEQLPADLQPSQMGALKRGDDLFDDAGNLVVRNADVTRPPRRARSYAYCSDTRYREELIGLVRDVDLLYHESTFTDEYAERAATTHHSTARQAAEVARAANVNRLLLGHYSSRYRDLTIFEQEARQVFPASYLSIEGQIFAIDDEPLSADA